MDWLYGLQKIGIKFGLNNIQLLCRLLGNPERRFPTVHIAGTNGKGSTAAFLTEIATSAGLRCGLTTSPHLVELTERIRIGRQAIPRDCFACLTNELMEVVEAYNHRFPSHPFMPTFFEATTALAFAYFAQEKVDLAVIEVGLGGRLDSTNVITPLVSIITSIGLEHTEYLGKTLAAIAREKGGIIKKGVPLLTAEENPEALRVLERICDAKDAECRLAGRDFTLEFHAQSRRFRYTDAERCLSSIQLALSGQHQHRNAALAVAAAFELKKHGFHINDTAIRAGLRATAWPGRLESFPGEPPWLLDCAHNPHAVETLVEYLAEHFSGKRVLCVFAAMKDKDHAAMLSRLSPFVHTWIFTSPPLERAELPKRLQGELPRDARAMIRKRVSDALRLAADREHEHDLILIAGSIFLVGASYRFVERHCGKSGILTTGMVF